MSSVEKKLIQFVDDFEALALNPDVVKVAVHFGIDDPDYLDCTVELLGHQVRLLRHSTGFRSQRIEVTWPDIGVYGKVTFGIMRDDVLKTRRLWGTHLQDGFCHYFEQDVVAARLLRA